MHAVEHAQAANMDLVRRHSRSGSRRRPPGEDSAGAVSGLAFRSIQHMHYWAPATNPLPLATAATLTLMRGKFHATHATVAVLVQRVEWLLFTDVAQRQTLLGAIGMPKGPAGRVLGRRYLTVPVLVVFIKA